MKKILTLVIFLPIFCLGGGKKRRDRVVTATAAASSSDLQSRFNNAPVQGAPTGVGLPIKFVFPLNPDKVLEIKQKIEEEFGKRNANLLGFPKVYSFQPIVGSCNDLVGDIMVSIARQEGKDVYELRIILQSQLAIQKRKEAAKQIKEIVAKVINAELEVNRSNYLKNS